VVYEVDFVVLDHAQPRIFEAKFAEHLSDEESKSAFKFMDKFPVGDIAAKVKMATIVTRNLTGARSFGEKKAEPVPLWQLLLHDSQL